MIEREALVAYKRGSALLSSVYSGKGHWFDNLGDLGRYKDPETAAALKECSDIGDELRQLQPETGDSERAMFLAEVCLFRANTYATLAEFREASGAVGGVVPRMFGLAQSARPEYRRIWGRYYLLAGEIDFAGGHVQRARKQFENLRFLVDHVGATEFSDVCDKRLALVGVR